MNVVVPLLVIVACVGLAGWLARRRWLVVAVSGGSMAPTLEDGERLIARRVQRRRGFSRGEVIVFRLSGEHDAEDPEFRIKRIAAVEHDLVPTCFRSESWAIGSARVPPGKVIIVGDNPRSQGSRELGYIDAGDIVGRLTIKNPRSRAP